MYSLEHYENKDKKEIDDNSLTPEDFAIKIKNLPDISEYQNIKVLKARLWNHLEYLMEKEP